jgi:hypothetical protein
VWTRVAVVFLSDEAERAESSSLLPRLMLLPVPPEASEIETRRGHEVAAR